MNKKYLAIFFLVGSALLFGKPAYALRDSQNIEDWYIQNFETNIVVNKDSSLLITENITADCGVLPNKHGIFRVLPTRVATDEGIIKNPIELVSITDFNGSPYKYETIKENNAITWKIGDADIFVQGVNNYRIVYKVKNAIRFGNPNFDELYWNLSGNLWDIDIDNFSAHMIFPQEINNQNATVDYYTGPIGSKEKNLATFFWSGNILSFQSVNILQPPLLHPKDGITSSIILPKNIFSPYVPTFMEKYEDYFSYLFFLIPIMVFNFAFNKWKKFGKDPKMRTPITPEFGIPENLTPIQMGMILRHGQWDQKFITATIIDLAVRKIITIEEIKGEGFLAEKDIVLRKNLNNYDLSKLTQPEKLLLNAFFANNDINLFQKVKQGLLGKSPKNGNLNEVLKTVEMSINESSTNDVDSVKLSTIKRSLPLKLLAVTSSATEESVNKNWIAKDGSKYMAIFIAVGVVSIWLTIFAAVFYLAFFISILFSAIILIIFGVLMTKRTQAGADLLFKIKGFELYMKTAENYRQKFYEKENIFDKFLPYAIVFGIAELWAKKMEIVYGKDYFTSYHPSWMVGATSASFNLNSFTSQLNSITTSISSSTGSSSGSGGGGSSGGGGGGGGGGGW